MRIATMMLAGALARTEEEGSQPRFITKGDVAMELRMKDKARAGKDVDLVICCEPYEGCQAA